MADVYGIQNVSCALAGTIIA